MSIDGIVKIIARRDGISEEEARAAVEECIEEIEWTTSHSGNLDEIEDIVADYLGLEPDYIPALIGLE